MKKKYNILTCILLCVAFNSVGNAQQKSAIPGPYLYHFTGGDSEFKDQDDMETLDTMKKTYYRMYFKAVKNDNCPRSSDG